MTTFLDAVSRYAHALRTNFASHIVAQPEDQLKSPVQELLRAAGRSFGLPVETRTEVRVAGLGGRPDIGVQVKGLLAGHVELKAPGKGATTSRLTGADKKQWEKFKALPNVVYTDGSDWALYRSGELRGRAVRLGADLTTEGEKTLDEEAAAGLSSLLRDFLIWEPVVPTSPKDLAETLAPLCHLLREEVLAALTLDGSIIAQLADEWREALFPDADDRQFADAYAQTITYGLLLARFEGNDRVGAASAEAVLQRRHGLLARALRLLSDTQVRAEINLGIDLLERVISVVDTRALQKLGADPWLYFYEDFLAKYDPKLRADRGVYYTPAEVIKAQCNLATDLLEKRFDKRLSFADDGVVLLDPGAGTGAYLLFCLQQGLARVEEQLGPGAVPGRATVMAQNTHGFEILVGPYTVAHLRLTQQLQDAGADLPTDGVHVYLTDTLDSPHAEPRTLSFLNKPLADEHRRAQRVKRDAQVLVCLGNPPYDRQQIEASDELTERKGGWVRFGEGPADDTPPLLDSFLRPAREAGYGVHLKNLYNDYVYFWRWALWKVFEATQGPGIVTFITAASYLRGPAFVGMRQVMRELADEIWILDLEGDKGPRKTENVFAIQTPVAIALAARYGKPQPEKPATTHYTKFQGTRAEKLAQLAATQHFSGLDWKECQDGWRDPFLPRVEGSYFQWPQLTQIFPCQFSGVQFKRTWPIGATRPLLQERWSQFLAVPIARRRKYFRETTARLVDRPYVDALERGRTLIPLAELASGTPPPGLSRYAFRSFDRQWALLDARFADRIRPSLLRTYGSEQVFLTTLLAQVLGSGPAATISADVPDLHHFRGSFGGKDVIPLWLDSSSSAPNITRGLLKQMAAVFGKVILPEELFAYCYSLLASPEYVTFFAEELTHAGPRIPLTRDGSLFDHGVALGRRLGWLHTFGERWVPDGEVKGRVPPGRARSVRPIPSKPEEFPETFRYDVSTETLFVGDGSFAPVVAKVWEFSVSGLDILKSWLSYRMKGGAGRTSSKLDEIRLLRWTAELTEELLNVLWVLEATVSLLPQLKANLVAVVAGPVFAASELPKPTEEEQRPLNTDGEAGEEGERMIPGLGKA